MNNETKTDNVAYESGDLQALGDLEAIRDRPGMYLGDTIHPGHVYTEVLDNSGDEAFAGHCKQIIATVDTKANTYQIRDYGRGIPIGTTQFTDITGATHELEALQLLFIKTHSGGKFGDKGAYKISRGMHGVGLKIVNAVSTHAEAITYRDGKFVKLTMSQGNILNLERGETTEPNGVSVKFTPDIGIFNTDIIPIDHILQITGISRAFGVPVKLIINGEETTLPYNQIEDLLPTVNSKNTESTYLTHELRVDDPNGSGEHIKCVIRYTSETNTLYRGYTNMIPNPGGGSHIRFLEDCYMTAWKKYVDSEFLLKDVLVGFRGLSAVFISNKEMAFAGQTKERLTTNKSYFNKFRDPLVKAFNDYFDNQVDVRKGLIKRFSEYRAAQNKLLASKEISSLIIVNEDDTANTGLVRRRSVVAKLRECTSKSRKGTKLWINEGDSAAGTVIAARDYRYDAVLPLRGKIKNTSGMKITDALKSEEVRNIVNSIGAGVGDNCDATKSRYEEVDLVVDADYDGLNIAALVTCSIVTTCPDVIRQGLFYIVEPPLYGWKRKKPVTEDGYKYEYEFTNDVSKIPAGVKFTRYKGLGEMSPEEFYEGVMSPKANKIQVELPPNPDEFHEIMTSSSLKYKALQSLGLVYTIDNE